MRSVSHLVRICRLLPRESLERHPSPGTRQEAHTSRKPRPRICVSAVNVTSQAFKVLLSFSDAAFFIFNRKGVVCLFSTCSILLARSDLSVSILHCAHRKTRRAGLFLGCSVLGFQEGVEGGLTTSKQRLS